MKTREIEVDGELGLLKADLILCSHCDCEVFVQWRVQGQQGWHLQCTNCDATFCIGHECAKMIPNEPKGDNNAS